jgi:hypothetical protein
MVRVAEGNPVRGAWDWGGGGGGGPRGFARKAGGRREEEERRRERAGGPSSSPPLFSLSSLPPPSLHTQTRAIPRRHLRSRLPRATSKVDVLSFLPQQNNHSKARRQKRADSFTLPLLLPPSPVRPHAQAHARGPPRDPDRRQVLLHVLHRPQPPPPLPLARARQQQRFFFDRHCRRRRRLACRRRRRVAAAIAIAPPPPSQGRPH